MTNLYSRLPSLDFSNLQGDIETSAKVKPVDTKTFEQEVLRSDRPVLVDFYADWCGPCQVIKPILEEVAEDYDNRIDVRKVDVDENQSLAQAYGVPRNSHIAAVHRWRGAGDGRRATFENRARRAPRSRSLTGGRQSVGLAGKKEREGVTASSLLFASSTLACRARIAGSFNRTGITRVPSILSRARIARIAGARDDERVVRSSRVGLAIGKY